MFSFINKIKNSIFLYSVFILLVLTMGFVLGWVVRNKNYNNKEAISLKNLPLRLGEHQYTNPLLLCDSQPGKDAETLKPLADKINSFVADEEKKQNVSAVSVFFRNLKTGEEVSINPEEKFHPASLGKIPMMIAYYKLAENNPNVLSQNIFVRLDKNYNSSQEITPSDSAKDSQTYTTEDLIEKMIKSSDNNSLAILGQAIGNDVWKKVYQDLQVPFIDNPSNSAGPDSIDFMTSQRFSFFFRVLYNATYLNPDLSEKALQILASTDFKNGLVAGVPENIRVAHKFGLASLTNNNSLKVNSRELHDCGIVYYPNNPYLLCIMTKSTADLPSIENVIKNISSLTYQAMSQK